jgi:hypothetical protein
MYASSRNPLKIVMVTTSFPTKTTPQRKEQNERKDRENGWRSFRTSFIGENQKAKAVGATGTNGIG